VSQATEEEAGGEINGLNFRWASMKKLSASAGSLNNLAISLEAGWGGWPRQRQIVRLELMGP
jgi:hypothetical protein